MKICQLLCLFVLVMSSAVWNASAAAQQEIPIWPSKAPGSETWTHKEIQYEYPSPRMKMVRNVVAPSLTLYAPDPAKANGTAIIVAPGGGMRFLSWENEGTAVAEWLAARGVTAFVLKYRLLKTPEDPQQFDTYVKAFFAELSKMTDVSKIVQTKEMLEIRQLAVEDGLQAVKYVRAHAAQWKVDTQRIGMMGFSAGGYVTMGVVMADRPENRLNFAAPIYGGETGGRKVPSNAPPLFLLIAQDDRLVYRATQKLYSEWSEAAQPVELHSFAQGGHGFGMMKQTLPVDRWIELYGAWLDSLGLMKRGDAPHRSSLFAPTSEVSKQK